MAKSDISEQIRAKAKELLENGTVHCVIGYETGSDGSSARPAFIYDSSEVKRLVFDRTCTHNLVKYLMNMKDKPTAVVVKGCDSRAVNLLLSEKQLKRENIYIIGVVCPGTVEWGWGKDSDELQARCQRCTYHTPVVYDYLIGEPVEEKRGADYQDVEEAEDNPVEERASFWKEQAAKCIRCYACRQTCPGCYCKDCFVELLDPEWVGITIDTGENHMWNAIRAYHLAGRCIACNECERVCPMDIPLSLLNRKMEKETKKLFDYTPGMSEDASSPLNTFKKDDKVGIGE